MERVDAERRKSNAAIIASRIKELEGAATGAAAASSSPAVAGGGNARNQRRRQSAVFLADVTGGLLDESKALRVVRRLENFLEKRELTMGFGHWKMQVRQRRNRGCGEPSCHRRASQPCRHHRNRLLLRVCCPGVDFAGL